MQKLSDAEIEKMARKRLSVMEELIKTEHEFVSDMRMLYKNFAAPLATDRVTARRKLGKGNFFFF